MRDEIETKYGNEKTTKRPQLMLGMKQTANKLCATVNDSTHTQRASTTVSNQVLQVDLVVVHGSDDEDDTDNVSPLSVQGDAEDWDIPLPEPQSDEDTNIEGEQEEEEQAEANSAACQAARDCIRETPSTPQDTTQPHRVPARSSSSGEDQPSNSSSAKQSSASSGSSSSKHPLITSKQPTTSSPSNSSKDLEPTVSSSSSSSSSSPSITPRSSQTVPTLSSFAGSSSSKAKRAGTTPVATHNETKPEHDTRSKTNKEASTSHKDSDDEPLSNLLKTSIGHGKEKRNVDDSFPRDGLPVTLPYVINGVRHVFFQNKWVVEGFCLYCKQMAVAWEEADHNITPGHIQTVIVWMRVLYNATMLSCKEQFPHLVSMLEHHPSYRLRPRPTATIEDPVDIDDEQSLDKLRQSLTAWYKQRKQHHLWVCHNNRESVVDHLAVLLATWKDGRAALSLVCSTGHPGLMAFYSAKLFLHGRIDTQHDKAWPQGQMALGYLVGVVEEKLRSVFAETHKLIADRVQYAATVACEHIQNRAREPANERLFEVYEKLTKKEKKDSILQAITNVMGLGNMHEPTDFTQVIHNGAYLNNYKKVVWYPGEKVYEDESQDRPTQQWWWNPVQAFILPMTIDSASQVIVANLFKAYDMLRRVEARKKPEGKKAGRIRVPHVPKAGNIPPMTNAQLWSKLYDIAPDWNWKKGNKHPFAWDENQFNSLFQQLGFGIILLNKLGDDLTPAIAAMRHTWNVNIKEVITNDGEIICMNGERLAFIRDHARMQVALEGTGHKMPGIDVIEKHFPRYTQGKMSAAIRRDGNNPKVTLEYIVGNHPAAQAQQAHNDFCLHASGGTDVRAQLGSAILSLTSARIILWMFSHMHKAEYKFIPVTINLVPGSIFMFTNIVHAGYGIWPINDLMWRPVPTSDDVMRTILSQWLIRYQCHITRVNEQGQPHPYTAKPDMQVRDRFPNLASYIHFDHGTPLPEIFPPVFAAEGHNHMKIVLKYSDFRSTSSSEDVVSDDVKEQQQEISMDERLARELHASLNPDLEEDERLARQIASEDKAKGRRGKKRTNKRTEEPPKEKGVQVSAITNNDNNAMDIVEDDEQEVATSQNPQSESHDAQSVTSTKRNREHDSNRNATVLENIENAKKLKITEVKVTGQATICHTFLDNNDHVELEDNVKQLLRQCSAVYEWIHWLDDDIDRDTCMQRIVFATLAQLGYTQHPANKLRNLWQREYYKYNLAESGTYSYQTLHLPSPFVIAALYNVKKVFQGDLAQLFTMEIPQQEILAIILALDAPAQQVKAVLYVKSDKSYALWSTYDDEAQWRILCSIINAARENQMQVGVNILVIGCIYLPMSEFPSDSFKKDEHGAWRPPFAV